ncbi:MAG: GldG family protein [Treponema sp.]|nr:GldG family protein [Treponema sp.]
MNLVHSALNFVQLGDFLSEALRSISFAWRFDSASKGILDSRDFSFFALAALFFLSFSAFVSEREKGKKYFSKKNALRSWTMVFLFVFLALDSSRIYTRVDFSAGKIYSPSERTKSLLEAAQEKVRVTYLRSSNLIRLYPQVRDVGDFLRSLSHSCKNFSYSELDAQSAAAKKILDGLDVQPLQIQRQDGDSLEYVNAYSAVIIDYMDKSLCVPAAFSTFGLEYDLNLRLDFLIKQKSRRAYMLCGNGMSLKKDYKSAVDWLNLEGFETIELSKSDLPFAALDKTIPLALFGTNDLGQEEAAAIFSFANGGGRLLAMASPYTVNVNGDWSLKKNKLDYMLPLLEMEGVSFSESLAADLSCVRANFYSSDKKDDAGGNVSAENKSVNYPLWINLLPQEGAPYGANVFWASPLSLDKAKAEPLLISSPASWRFLPDKKNPGLLFDTNPFTVPKTAIADPLVQKEESVLAARTLDKKIIVISGDLFANDLLLSLSGGETGDFRNFNYLTTSLLELSGESDMAALKNKGAADFSLWKISESREWQSAKNLSLLLNFAALPLALLFLMAAFFFKEKGF